MIRTLVVLSLRACSATESCHNLSAILVRVLTLVCLVVANDTSYCGARSSVSSHVPRGSPDYRAFNASLGICRSACSEGRHSQHEQCNEHFHLKSPSASRSI